MSTCPHCGQDDRTDHARCAAYLADHRALTEAHRHAATCPALRLAALTRDLEGLREKWLGIAYRSHSGDHALGYTMATADLTAVLARAGGTGC